DLAAAQGVDEAEGCQIFEIDPSTKCRLAGEKITRVDRPGRFTVDLVEHRGQPDTFHGDQCSPGDDAPHASALDDEPEPRVEPPTRAAFLEETETPLDLLDDRVVWPRVRPGSAGRIRRSNHALKLVSTLLTHADG